MAKDYVVTYGSVMQGGLKKLGDSVTLEESEAALMDPDGTCLKLKSLVDAEAAGEKAKSDAIAANAKKDATGSKGGGK